MLSLSLFVPAVATLAYKLNEARKEREEKNKTKPRITDIRIYPIKSCHGISLKTGKITNLGFEYDRAWMVVDAVTYRFVTQRQISKMATIVSEFRGEELWINAPGMDTLKIPLATTKSASIEVQVWDDKVMAIDEGETAAKWFSKFLEKEVKLARVDPKEKRPCSAKYTSNVPGPRIVSFADGFPFLLFSRESLRFLNENVPGGGIPLTNFRPNIVVENAKAPFDEDTWTTFHIRGITFHAVKPCERCKITTINQDTGVPSEGEPLATLQRVRRKEDGGAIFGQNITHETEGYICVGDVVEIDT